MSLRGLLVVMSLLGAWPVGATSLRVPGLSSAIMLPSRLDAEPLGEGLQINGRSTHVWLLQSPRPTDELLGELHREWRTRARRVQVGPWSVIVDRRAAWLLTVQLQDLPLSGGSTGLLSVARFETAPGEPPQDLPPLTQTQTLQDIRARDLGRRSRTRVLVSARPVAQVMDVLRTHYRSQGYVPVGDRSLVRHADGASMALQRAGAQLDVAVAQVHGETVIAIVEVWP